MPKCVTGRVILTGASTRQDGSLALRFATPELTPDEKTAFFELLNLDLSLLLQPADGAVTELKEIKGEFDRKTPGQRLRASIFVLWKQQAEPGDFDAFYLRRMEELIQQIQQQLEPKP